ncbi:redox-sensitive transcriptional activator SoxR [Plantactinospora sp. KBS50]|uniref:redox-sensitive transcriptional activator SoxR n=1 Tax=Plantactinospora sp. KBS50 TaxID=2024580 RepID=UPI000BAAE75B|nr:redox-sensitive transcriptional activator SoxR [Plantactinospora sp. KBS50]ASW53750.1 redox-sensitive transcriptional activator SoxR [Plantactinospora sp. KBS50]
MTHTSPIAKELTVGELARRSGVSTSALRFYEHEGLIRSRRTSGNQRRYSRDTLRRVAFIRVSQRVGIPLTEIAEALSILPTDRAPSQEQWVQLSENWRADLDRRITQLLKLRDELIDCIGCGCLTLERCVLINPYDVLGRQAPDRAGCRSSEDLTPGPRPRRAPRCTRSTAGAPTPAGRSRPVRR